MCDIRSGASFVLILLTLATYSNVANGEQNATSSTATSRTGRQLDIPRNLRVVRIFLDQNQHLRRPPPPPPISVRSDHFPQRIGPGPGPGPMGFGRPPFSRPPLQQPMPHIRRRVHTGPPGPPPPGMFMRPNGPPPQYNNYQAQAFKNTRYVPAKGPYPQKGAPIGYFRQEQGQVAPNLNAIPQAPNFKPSPIYNGEVIVRQPSAAPLVSAQPTVQPPQQQENFVTPLQQKRPMADHSQHMYSVYEDIDSDLENSYSQMNIGENAMKEAKQYLNFMSSSEYFLPKIEPDYRKLDQAKQQQKQQQQLAESAFQQHQLQQQQRISESSNLNAAFTVNAPLRVSASSSAQKEQQSHADNTISPTSAYPSRTVPQSHMGIGNSHQADNNNVFVVSSDGIKNMHHIVSGSSSSSSSSSSPSSSSSYPKVSQQNHNSMTFSSGIQSKHQKERIPDPERVEFTERDAIHVSYTSNPMDSMSRYNEKHQHQHQQHQQQQQSSHSDRRYSLPTSMQEEEDDDEEMMQAASISDIYGRIKVKPTETAPNPTLEQKDTEEYCERICSNVQDEDEEIVCGSDGFMYTSEAQMECYASCLHIDVTIQSKGTCNQPL